MNGENVLDHWVPQLELGFPWFIYYQPLPALVAVVVHRGFTDSSTSSPCSTFKAVRYILFVTFPLSVFWSPSTDRREYGRRVGRSQGGAASLW